MPGFDIRGYLSEAHAALPADGIDRNNKVAVFLMGALPAVGGSAISVILYASFVWAILSLALGRFDYRMTRSDRMLAWTFTIFALAIAVTAFAGRHPAKAPHDLVWLLGFLSPWVVIPRLRARSNGNYLTAYIAGAAVGAIAACAVAFLEMLIMKTRPEAGAGNAAVFAVMALCLMGLGALNVGSGSPRRAILGLGAALGGSLAVLLSLTRGVMLIVPPVVLLAVAYAPAAWRSAFSRKAVLIGIGITGVVIFAASHMLEVRADYTLQEIQQIDYGELTTSVGLRLRMWSAALEAVANSPIWGYGVQNRMDVLMPLMAKEGIVLFSHAHNGFLTFSLDGGIVVLAALIVMVCAPVAVALRAPRDAAYRLRLFMALTVTGAYVLCGMSQIMFKHDIMDSFFILFAIVLAASIPDEAAEAAAGETLAA